MGEGESLHNALRGPASARAGDGPAFHACAWPVASATRAELDEIFDAARSHGPEAAVVVSCQRVEVYHTDGCTCGASGQWSGFDALLRLAEVAAGLHSLVLGEEQVLGQVRAGVAAAGAGVRRQAVDAIAAARLLRAETRFRLHTGHLLDRALHLAGVGPGGRVVVVGAGAVGGLVAQRAAALGFDDVTVVGRRLPAGAWFDPGTMTYEPLDRLPHLAATEVLVSCLGSGAAPLDPGRLPPVRRLAVDLGTPRNIGDAARVPVISIADMLAAEDGNRHSEALRARLRARLRDVLEQRLAAAGEGRSAVGQLRAEVERLREAEARRIARLHPELPRETVETITRSLINQVFHRPTARLRASGDDDLGQRLVELFASEEVRR